MDRDDDFIIDPRPDTEFQLNDFLETTTDDFFSDLHTRINLGQQQEQRNVDQETQEQEVGAEVNILPDDVGVQPTNTNMAREEESRGGGQNENFDREEHEDRLYQDLLQFAGNELRVSRPVGTENLGAQNDGPENHQFNENSYYDNEVLENQLTAGNGDDLEGEGHEHGELERNQEYRDMSITQRETQEENGQSGIPNGEEFGEQQQVEQYVVGGNENESRAGEENWEVPFHYQTRIESQVSTPYPEYEHQEYDHSLAALNQAGGSDGLNIFGDPFVHLNSVDHDPMLNPGGIAESRDVGDDFGGASDQPNQPAELLFSPFSLPTDIFPNLLENTHNGAEHGPPQHTEGQVAEVPFPQHDTNPMHNTIEVAENRNLGDNFGQDSPHQLNQNDEPLLLLPPEIFLDIPQNPQNDAEHGPSHRTEQQGSELPFPQMTAPVLAEVEQEIRQIMNQNSALGGPNHSLQSPSNATGQEELNDRQFSQPQNQDPSGHHTTSNFQRQERSQGEAFCEVEHDQEHLENLRWIASMLPGIDGTESEDISQLQTPELRMSQARGEGDLLQQELHTAESATALDRSTPESIRLSERYLRRDATATQNSSTHGALLPSSDFSSNLIAMRLAGRSCGEILGTIGVPKLPQLDDEMASSFQGEETESVPWTVQDSSSPTLSRIAQDVKKNGELFTISLDLLFNHLFRLSRDSFLQREERVHLELMTHFFSTWRTEQTRQFVTDAKELVVWLETKFTSANLAAMVQRLVNGIDGNGAIRYLVQAAKVKYNPNPVEMTLLGAFFALMSKHSDILGSNKNMAKRKKTVDADIKKAKAILITLGQEIPKSTYGKSSQTDTKTKMARESCMIATFAATRWSIVGCAHSHYAYGCSVLEAAAEVHNLVQAEHTMDMEKLKDEFSNLGRPRNETEEENEVVPANVVTRRVELINRHKIEQVRPVFAVESILLNCFKETMKDLGKIKVAGLLRTIGGAMPMTLAKVLAEIENELETLRGVGLMGGLVVSDIVKVREMVDKEAAKNKSTTGLLERKEAYLQQCQNMIIAIQAAAESGAGPSSA